MGPFSKGSQLKIKIFLPVLFLLLSVTTPVANAASDTGYRYWGYYQAKSGDSKWNTAMTGPTTNVADGSVEGWAFTFAGEVINTGAPKTLPDFEKICGSTPPLNGSKRVGLVVEFGPIAIAPKGEKPPKQFSKCVVIAKSATGFEILSKASKIRTNASGMTCGIANFPKKECSEKAIKTPTGLK